MTPHHDETCVTVMLPFADASVRRARTLLTADLRQVGVDGPVVDDAVLVLSELVTNGVKHGKPGEDGTIEICWCVLEDHVHLSVQDGGTVETLRPLALNTHSLRGRGLAIVDYVCDSWKVARDGGTRITAEVAIA